jgi:hypothetical protein
MKDGLIASAMTARKIMTSHAANRRSNLKSSAPTARGIALQARTDTVRKGASLPVEADRQFEVEPHDVIRGWDG